MKSTQVDAVPAEGVVAVIYERPATVLDCRTTVASPLKVERTTGGVPREPILLVNVINVPFKTLYGGIHVAQRMVAVMFAVDMPSATMAVGARAKVSTMGGV
jgi:hypothetical protein